MNVVVPKRQAVDELDCAPTARIARLARRLRYAFEDTITPFGLTSVQFGLLNRLALSDGLVQAELGRRMAIEPATLTGMVQRLEREGWVRRAGDPDNRRLQRVWLTDKTREALPALRGLYGHYQNRALAGLDVDQLAQLEGLLERIEANLR